MYIVMVYSEKYSKRENYMLSTNFTTIQDISTSFALLVIASEMKLSVAISSGKIASSFLLAMTTAKFVIRRNYKRVS